MTRGAPPPCRRRLAAPLLLAALQAPLAPRVARGEDAGDHPAPPPAPAPAQVGAEVHRTSCVEHIPPGATRPRLVERLSDRALSGHALELEIDVHHGKGETVLPHGFRIQSGSDAARALADAGFVLPDPDGGASPSLEVAPAEAGGVTRLRIPVVPLPERAGRHRLVLPPVPVAVARASGELVTVCTTPHPVIVEDPIASTPDPAVRPNPPPRPQREVWIAAQNAFYGLLAGIAAALAGAWLVRRWRSRPRPVPHTPPPPPWVVALSELRAVRESNLLETGRTDVYVDRVSDAVRKYLGARYGFDGLESTTDEIRAALRRVRPRIPELRRILELLSDCDLVKFARMVPDEAACLDTMERAEGIVRATLPAPGPDPGAAAEETLAEGGA